MDEAGDIELALRKRKQWILENIQTLTLKQCRQQLEEDEGLESGALKHHKSLIETLIAKIVQEVNEESAAPEHSEEDTRRRGSPAGSPKQRFANRKRKRGPPTKPSGPQKYGKKVEKLRNICKAATISIAPTLYVKNKTETELLSALETLLEKHDLTVDAGPNEIAKVKSKLQIQRDLDGIDTTNILEGGRRHRGAATVSYRSMLKDESESEEEEDSEDESEEAGQEEKSDTTGEEEDNGREVSHSERTAEETKSFNENKVDNCIADITSSGMKEKLQGFPLPKEDMAQKQVVLDWSDEDD